jgi:hypothetical protein
MSCRHHDRACSTYLGPSTRFTDEPCQPRLTAYFGPVIETVTSRMPLAFAGAQLNHA